MKPLAPKWLWTEKGLLVLSGLSALLAFSTLHWNADLERFRQSRLKQYRTDLALSQNRQEHERVYGEILSREGARPGEYVEPNEWMRQAQGMVREHGLDLREITPVAEKDTDRRSQPRLSMVLEGEMKDWAALLHRLAGSSGPGYVEEFKVTPIGAQTNRLRIEMVMAQP